ncbi:aminotransferase [Aspergillus undulatus]|uniref:aminotransferase n=1 Tax=Aspergillus undulatus TaxID=1810928 RepID=UPI003CCD3F78
MLDLLTRYVEVEKRFIPELPGHGGEYQCFAARIGAVATRSPVRAWPGGVGEFKIGGNHAPSIVPQEEAAAAGSQQNLWLLADGGEECVTEAGTMNLFVVWVNPSTGQTELVTPPLDGTRLPGVTRESILELARERLSGP